MSTHGYQPYKPQKSTQSVIQAAKSVLVEYEAWERPMTVRQVFYRLVAEYSFAKTEKAYNSLIGYIARSRRAYQHRVIEELEGGLSGEEAVRTAMNDMLLIPFDWIRDERGKTHTVLSFEDTDEFRSSLEDWIEDLQRDRTVGQPRLLELWCEAAGMVPLMREIAQPFGLRVSSGGGYDSVTAKHKLAKRVAVNFKNTRRPTLVLHIGDFDPSGEGMFNTLEEDVGEMVYQLLGRDLVSFERIALTEDQVIDMGVETAPPKEGDSRRPAFVAAHPRIAEHLGTDEITAQLEALTPPELVELVEGAIREHLDEEAFEEIRSSEEKLREQIRDELGLNG